jgi:hydroxyethylthiazole kinase-like uncharacterized protein yjeF
MNVLYSVQEIRDIEQAVLATLPQGTLMQRAGQAAAKAALALIPNPIGDAKVLVVAGPGNNGGDALETATRLSQAGAQVTILLYADPHKQSPDSKQALARAQGTSARFADPAFLPDIYSTRWTFVLDGLYGIGLARPIAGNQHSLVSYINTLSCPILALDVPSGLNADTGNIVGEHGIAVRASHTITFIANKPGLHTGSGRDYAGQVQVAKLDIENKFFKPAHVHLNDIKLFSSALQQRMHNTHKGSYGDVAIIGGAHGMGGAPILAGRAAAQCGAGRVYVAFIGETPAYDTTQPELMCRPANGFDHAVDALVAGPGMGTSREAHDALAHALSSAAPLALDADALNLIADEPGLKNKLKHRRHPTLLTPHPLEAARLLNATSASIQANRLEAARELAQLYRTYVVLKGSGTVITRPDGYAVVNTTGNPALATAGTGDVLSGICGALLAQHWPVWEAALGAVWLHGYAADQLVEQGVGPIGLTASELVPAARTALNQLTHDYAPR